MPSSLHTYLGNSHEWVGILCAVHLQKIHRSRGRIFLQAQLILCFDALGRRDCILEQWTIGTGHDHSAEPVLTQASNVRFIISALPTIGTVLLNNSSIVPNPSWRRITSTSPINGHLSDLCRGRIYVGIAGHVKLRCLPTRLAFPYLLQSLYRMSRHQ